MYVEDVVDVVDVVDVEDVEDVEDAEDVAVTVAVQCKGRCEVERRTFNSDLDRSFVFGDGKCLIVRDVMSQHNTMIRRLPPVDGSGIMNANVRKCLFFILDEMT